MSWLKKQQGKISIIVVLVLAMVVAIGVYVGYKNINQAPDISLQEPVFREGTFEQPMEKGESGGGGVESRSRVETEGMLMVQEGNLIQEGGEWVVLYDDAKTGSPAAILRLVFNTNSRCDLGEGFGECNFNDFKVGLRVRVEGVDKEGRMVVKNLRVFN